MSSSRFRFARAAIAVVACLGLVVVARAQTFPAKPARIVVPVSAGGLTDVLTRAIAQELGKRWSQPVLVENRPGAGHIIATEYVVKSPPDGYTILITDRAMTANPSLYRKLPYDAFRDLAPVANLVLITDLLLAAPQFPANTLADVVRVAKAKPGEVNYGSFGKGTVTHVDMEAFATSAGIKLTHVPYKGIADVLPALASGQIQIAFSGIPPALPLVRQGKLKAIAYAGERRSPLLPDVPTFAEAGMGGFDSQSWTGLFVPAGTPRAVVDRIAADVERILAAPEFREKFVTGVGLEPAYMSPDKFAEFLKEDRTKNAARIKDLDVVLD